MLCTLALASVILDHQKENMSGGKKVSTRKIDETLATIENYIYNLPTGSKLEVAIKKRGRGRPRKRVAVEGLVVHQEPLNSTSKFLTPKDRYDIRHRYAAYERANPGAGIQAIIDAISEEREMTYKQVYEVVFN
jgi:hypothetical protein